MSGSQSFCGSLFVACDVCRMAGPDIAGKTEFVTGKKKFKRESVVYHNKSQKNEKCFNIWYQQKPIP